MNSEEELYNILRGRRLKVIKVPLSGRGSELPDLLLIHNSMLYGIEVKETSKLPTKYYYKSFDNLIDFISMFSSGGIIVRGFLAVKYSDKWYLREVNIKTVEVTIPDNDTLNIDEFIRMLRGKRGRRLSCSIRLMGDKKAVSEVLPIIKASLNSRGFKMIVRELPVYKDKKTRREIDSEKTRLYITISRIH